MILISAVVISNVSIKSSTNSPTAGENFTLTCSAVSEGPTVLRWMGPNGENINADAPNLSLRSTTGSSSVSFLPLHTSNAGAYTCIASIIIDGIVSVQTAQKQHSFTVQSKLYFFNWL